MFTLINTILLDLYRANLTRKRNYLAQYVTSQFMSFALINTVPIALEKYDKNRLFIICKIIIKIFNLN